MSQHNIVGSEAFEKRPQVYLRSVRSGGARRLRARTALAFGLGVAVTVVAGVIAAAAVFMPAV